MAESTFDAFTAAEAPISSSGMEEDPAADFLAQQESEIAGIESDGYSILDTGEMPSDMQDFSGPIGELNGDIYKEANGPSDGFAAVAQADKLSAEPESLRRWREDQTERLEEMDVTSRKLEGEWREKARHELEEWYVRQSEQLEKTRKNNRVADGAFYKQQNADMIGYMAAEEAFVQDRDEESPGTEWERVARLCDFNPKSTKQSKDVSRMRSIIISLKQSPLVR
uniref:clathrin light chain A-like isoform X1 n=1 Tax=Myxine glutinosa TaxID=7769 RepID=UPI00358F5DB5